MLLYGSDLPSFLETAGGAGAEEVKFVLLGLVSVKRFQFLFLQQAARCLEQLLEGQ